MLFSRFKFSNSHLVFSGLFALALIVCQAMTITSLKAATDEPATVVDEEPAKYLLRFRFEPDQKVTYQINHENTRTLRKGNVQEITYDKSEAIKHFTVITVNAEGTAKVESMIDQVKLTARFNNKGKPVVYDSTSSAPPPPVFKKVKETIGKPIAETTFSTRGSIVKSKYLLPNSTPAAPKPGKQKSDLKSDPSRNFLLEFPEEAISIDDRWSYKFQIDNLQIDQILTRSATMRREYRLKEVKGDIALITFKTNLLSPIRDPKVLTQLKEKKLSGEIKFDMQRGVLISRTAHLDKTEFGFDGPSSSSRTVSNQEETLASIETVTNTRKHKEPAKAEKIIDAKQETASNQ